MTAEDEEAHEDPTRAEGTPRTIPPPRARGQPHAAVPAVCGGVPGVFLARRAMFRCMCDETLENCRAKSGDGDGVILTTTAFEKHCGMEKSKNWRNSVSVVCSDHQRPVKIDIWLGEVGIDVARGKGGGAAAGGSSNKSSGGGADADASKRKGGKLADDRWHFRAAGPPRFRFETSWRRSRRSWIGAGRNRRRRVEGRWRARARCARRGCAPRRPSSRRAGWRNGARRKPRSWNRNRR